MKQVSAARMADAISPHHHQYIGHRLAQQRSSLTAGGGLNYDRQYYWASHASARQVRVGDRRTNERTDK